MYLEEHKPIWKQTDEEYKYYSQAFNIFHSSIMVAAPVTNLGIVEPGWGLCTGYWTVINWLLWERITAAFQNRGAVRRMSHSVHHEYRQKYNGLVLHDCVTTVWQTIIIKYVQQLANMYIMFCWWSYRPYCTVQGISAHIISKIQKVNGPYRPMGSV